MILPLSAEDVSGWNENLQTVPLGAPYSDKQIICKSIFENANHLANNLWSAYTSTFPVTTTKGYLYWFIYIVESLM